MKNNLYKQLPKFGIFFLFSIILFNVQAQNIDYKEQARKGDSIVYGLINKFSTLKNRKVAKALYDNFSGFSKEDLTIQDMIRDAAVQGILTVSYFYDEFITLNSVIIVLGTTSYMGRSNSYFLAAFDDEYNLLSFVESSSGRHSEPSYQLVNYDGDCNKEILITMQDNPSANSFENVSVELFKFNPNTKKIVCIFMETTHDLGYCYECAGRNECSYTNREITYSPTKINIQQKHIQLICGKISEDRYSMQAAEETKTTTYFYEWDEQAYKFVKQ